MSFSVLGGYNEHDYNAALYNDNDLYVSLAESLASSDARTYVDSLTPTELVTLAENLIRYFNGQIFMDTLTLTDEALKTAVLAKLDSVSVTDAALSPFPLKNLVESLTPADVRTFVMAMQRVDAVTLVDALSKQITNKRVTETISLNEWFTVKQNPQSDPWS